MSAYSEWKCGALSDEQFEQYGREYNRSEYHAFDDPCEDEDEYEYEDEDDTYCSECVHYKDFHCGEDVLVKCCECETCEFKPRKEN